MVVSSTIWGQRNVSAKLVPALTLVLHERVQLIRPRRQHLSRHLPRRTRQLRVLHRQRGLPIVRL